MNSKMHKVYIVYNALKYYQQLLNYDKTRISNVTVLCKLSTCILISYLYALDTVIDSLLNCDTSAFVAESQGL